MKQCQFLLSLAALCVITQTSFAEEKHGGTHHWGYDGENGPTHWGETCATGKAQSPIDLHWSKPKSNEEIKIDYQSSNFKIIDNGHTLQVNFDPGSKAIIHGKTYALVQMHFHTDSEHSLSGKHFPLELHLVHKDSEGKLAVLGVFIAEGKQNAFIESVFSQFPEVKEKEIIKESKINAKDFIPNSLHHYHYEGSLTTPPCTEGVSWNVLNTPITASSAQIEFFKKHYPHNARPVQNQNGRTLENF